MKPIDKLLKGIPLSQPTGSWVEPFEFEPAASSALQTWLSPEQIEALRARVELAKAAWADDASERAMGEEKRELERASEMAQAVATILQQAPPRASGELDLIFQKHLGGWEKKALMSAQLQVLAASIGNCSMTSATQDRRKSPVFLVSQIAEVLHTAGIKTSKTENSRFFKICRLVFESIGIYQDPRGSIRSYIAQRA